MTIEEFETSLSDTNPPGSVSSDILRALWYEGKDNWEAAHEIAQSREGTREYDRLHAYLHRVEGDDWNAGYWYRRAGENKPEVSLKQEWTDLVKKYLK